MKRERARDRIFFLKGKKKSKRKRKKNEGMSENRREIMCATRRYHHGRDFGELFSFFFLPQQQKKRKSDNLVWIFVLYLFPFHFPFKRKNIPLLRSQQSLDLNFDGDTLLLLYLVPSTRVVCWLVIVIIGSAHLK